MTAPRMNSAESDTADGGEVPEARQHPGTDAPENPAEVETVVEVVEVVVEGDAAAEEPTPRSSRLAVDRERTRELFLQLHSAEEGDAGHQAARDALVEQRGSAEREGWIHLPWLGSLPGLAPS